MPSTVLRSKAKAPTHALDYRNPGKNGSRFFGSNGKTLEASSDVDALKQMQKLLQAIQAGDVNLLAADEDVDTQELTAAEATEKLNAAYYDGDRSNWHKMGVSLAAEVYQRAERQGFMRNLLRKVDVAPGEKPEVEIVRNNVVALVMTTNAQIKSQYLYESDPTIIIDTYEIKGATKVFKKDLNRRGTMLLDRAETQMLEQFMVVEDRIWKRFVDEISGVELPGLTISGSLTPANIAYMRQKMINAGATPTMIVMANSFINDFLINQDFQGTYDPITQYELIRSGAILRYFNMEIFTDAVRTEPNLRVLSNGDFYMLASPEEHGFYVEPGGGIDMTEIDGAVHNESSRGWFGVEELGTIVFPNGSMKATRIS